MEKRSRKTRIISTEHIGQTHCYLALFPSPALHSTQFFKRTTDTLLHCPTTASLAIRIVFEPWRRPRNRKKIREKPAFFHAAPFRLVINQSQQQYMHTQKWAKAGRTFTQKKKKKKEKEGNSIHTKRGGERKKKYPKYKAKWKPGKPRAKNQKRKKKRKKENVTSSSYVILSQREQVGNHSRPSCQPPPHLRSVLCSCVRPYFNISLFFLFVLKIVFRQSQSIALKIHSSVAMETEIKLRFIKPVL